MDTMSPVLRLPSPLHVNAAVDTVRKQEHRALVAAGHTRLTRTNTSG